MQYIFVKCPNCGGTVKYNKEKNTIICNYCKNEIVSLRE